MFLIFRMKQTDVFLITFFLIANSRNIQNGLEEENTRRTTEKTTYNRYESYQEEIDEEDYYFYDDIDPQQEVGLQPIGTILPNIPAEKMMAPFEAGGEDVVEELENEKTTSVSTLVITTTTPTQDTTTSITQSDTTTQKKQLQPVEKWNFRQLLENMGKHVDKLKKKKGKQKPIQNKKPSQKSVKNLSKEIFSNPTMVPKVAEDNAESEMVFIENKIADMVELKRKEVNTRSWIKDIIQRTTCPMDFETTGGFIVKMERNGFSVSHKNRINHVKFGENDKFNRRIQQLIGKYQQEGIIEEEVCNTKIIEAAKGVHEETTTDEFSKLMQDKDEKVVVQKVAELLYSIEQCQQYCPKSRFSEFDFQQLQSEVLERAGIIEEQDFGGSILKCSDEMCVSPKARKKWMTNVKILSGSFLAICAIWFSNYFTKVWRNRRIRRKTPMSFEYVEEEERATQKLISVKHRIKPTEKTDWGAILATIMTVIQTIVLFIPDKAVVSVLCQEQLEK